MNDIKKTDQTDFIDVIYLAYGKPEYDSYVRDFFDSYKKYHSGLNHNLLIAAKAYENNLRAYKELAELAKENNAKIIDLPDDGMEFGAFYRTAKQSKSKYIFCLTTKSFILKNNWLNFFANAAVNNERYKLIGAMGSWENMFPGIAAKISRRLSGRGIKQQQPETQPSKDPNGCKMRFIRIKEAVLRPLSFPNFHIRTTAFLIDRKLYIEYIDKYGFPVIRYDAAKIESGYRSLTRFILKHGFKAGVVGADAKLYDTNEWDKSGTFRNPSPDNMIAGDHHCSQYLNSSKDMKIYLEKQAWGYSITEQKEEKEK